MQVPTLAVQNAVAREQLGTATSSATFFRSIGSSIGGAVFGTILVSRLTHHLQQDLPAGSQIEGLKNTIQGGAAQIAHLPGAARELVLGSFVKSFHDMFLIGIPLAIAALITALFLREAPLRTSHTPSEKSDDVVSHSPVEI